jgi:hypothetical protein
VSPWSDDFTSKLPDPPPIKQQHYNIKSAIRVKLGDILIIDNTLARVFETAWSRDSGYVYLRYVMRMGDGSVAVRGENYEPYQGFAVAVPELFCDSADRSTIIYDRELP